MSRSPWKIDRRTWLRGTGVACAMPYLEAMSHGESAPTASTAPKRMCFVYFPNGVSLPPTDSPDHAEWSWFPTSKGPAAQFTRVLEPLEPLREEVSVYGGFSHPRSRELLGHLAGDTWLTGGDLRGSRYLNNVSVDQVAARTLGQETRYRSLVLSSDGGIGYKSRISTLSFADGGRPIPAEHRQRQIFERYFSPGGGETTEERRRSLARGERVVDLVLEDARALSRRLGRRDQQRVDEYLESLNDVERRIRKSEAWLDVPIGEFDASLLELDAAANIDPGAYLRSMFDLMALGLRLDLTRVMTFMMAREDGMGFGENFPLLALGLKKGHHTISHDLADGHWAEWGAYDRWLAEQFAYFVDRLRSTEDEHGPLLDNTLVLYGSACSTTHNARNYPLVLAGGKRMGLLHNRYVAMPEETPMSNLLLSLLRIAGVETDRFSDSTGEVDRLLTSPS